MLSPPAFFLHAANKSNRIMELKAVTEHKLFKPALGAALTVLCGLLLWGTPLGEAWENASYDYLFRFASHVPGTNKVVLIQMDNAAHTALGRSRDQLWDRALHTRLLTNLTAGGCAVVVFDLFFETTNTATDAALAQAMRRHGQVFLAAELERSQQPGTDGVQIIPLNQVLVEAAASWGVAKIGAESGETARQHWPFPAPQKEYLSLPWVVAQLRGAHVKDVPQKQWLRYYGQDGGGEAIGGWKTISYHLALSPNPVLFSNAVVFVGYKPETPALNNERDEFGTPYLRWARGANKQSAGGMEILATEFLNLMNGDWLRRPAWWLEVLVLTVTGVLLGGGMCWKHSLPLACGLAIGSAFVVLAGAVWLSYFTNHWFPWLIIVGGQVPCALLYQIVLTYRGPELSDYEFFHQLGKGSYGKVRLVRSSIGQWQALKVVEGKLEACQREFRGIEQYKPVSEDYRELLRVELISRPKRDGSFFYVMELGEALAPGWQSNPADYQSRDLRQECAKYDKYRLPPALCFQIGIELAEALVILHENRLLHRDIKPSNAIFVKRKSGRNQGRWMLADVGLVAEIPPPGVELTQVFTEKYVAPGEPAGTVAADIYAFGKLLFVISTGRDPVDHWPFPTESLLASNEWPDLQGLNKIFCKACRPLGQPGQPAGERRYATAAEMLADLRKAQARLCEAPTRKI